jgi:DNA-binding PadR family transcriptional regulator
MWGHHFHHHRERHFGRRGGGMFRRGPFEMSWSFEGGERGGGRSRRMFDAGELRLVLLKLIADQPRHGYDLIRAIEELTAGAYAPSPGVIYPTITMLQDMGLIEEMPAEGSRKAFAITAEGTAHLEERAEEVAALIIRLSELGEMREKAEGVPIRRAMHNLKSVLAHRLTRDDVDKDVLHDVAEILDEAARKIERL